MSDRRPHSSFNQKKGVVWFRGNDLRLRDHLPLTTAHLECDEVVHISFVNPSSFISVSDGEPKIGWKRLLFLCECVSDIHQNLLSHNQNLHFFLGDPIKILPLLCMSNEISDIYCFDECIHDEQVELNNLEQCLLSNTSVSSPQLHSYWGGGTLITPSTLPFPIESLDTYTNFRKQVEICGLMERIPLSLEMPQLWKPDALNCIPTLFDNDICQKLEIPTVVNGDHNKNISFYTWFILLWNQLCNIQVRDEWKLLLSDNDSTTRVCPEVEEFLSLRLSHGINSPELCQQNHSAFPWIGGESSAWSRLYHYIHSNAIASYRQERNGMLGTEYSTKLSPFLALGCITSLQIIHEIKKYEIKIGGSDSNTTLIIAELLWRDYMRFYSLKHGKRLFWLSGVQGSIGYRKHPWKRDLVMFRCWAEGRTGYPTVDAHMIELAKTGYMSNRGRQVVASFLVRDMELDWRLGAELFERLLLDYDPCSNYGKIMM